MARKRGIATQNRYENDAASGPVRTNVVITGESFTGATSVTFGGVKATSFTVNSCTQITATVPLEAKTGKISVTAPGGTATKRRDFHGYVGWVKARRSNVAASAQTGCCEESE